MDEYGRPLEEVMDGEIQLTKKEELELLLEVCPMMAYEATGW